MNELIQKLIKNKEAKNAGWIVGGRIAQMILSFFVGVLTARYLGPQNYGIINYASAYVAFFSSFCTLGINSVIIKEFSDEPDKQGETIGTAILLRIISSILSIVLILSISRIFDGNELEINIIVGICSLSVIFQTMDTLNYWFQAKYQSKITSIATLIAYIVTSTYRIILLVCNKDVIWFAAALSVDQLCIAIILIISYFKYHGPKFSFSYKKAKRLLGKSYNYILSGMMVAIYGQTDKLMLKQMLDEEAVGYYSLASSINSLWVFLLAAVIDSIYPTIVALFAQSKDAFERKNRQLYAIVSYLSIFVAICIMLFGKKFIQIVYGDAYLGAAEPLSIICWYTMFSYLGVARNAWIVCNNQQKYLKYICAFSALANVILNLILIPQSGASGAALASLITQILTILLPCVFKEMRPNVKLMLDALLLRGIK